MGRLYHVDGPQSSSALGVCVCPRQVKDATLKKVKSLEEQNEAVETERDALKVCRWFRPRHPVTGWLKPCSMMKLAAQLTDVVARWHHSDILCVQFMYSLTDCCF